ncbi:hypothetical protein O1611_g3808 [Lasiodiplodia mahajangana]|uniref:Uncharacterized protein n=1 Tax=Lasiodiplodia mahajangana TaxID=1108764 RepID=A0ACC2JR22_9PEZI|nr:hypothetical protein O1611_g3808 [Lasiodiplodia mahajangana]
MNVFSNIPSADELERICLNHREESDTASFHNFPKLPPELRLMVWEYAISAQQIASLTQGDSSGIDDDIKYGRLPAFLFVNMECRQIALKMNRYPIRFSFRYCTCPDPTDPISPPVPPDHVHKGVQHCMIGPDDIVAVRLEKEWYKLWARNWKLFFENTSWVDNISPIRFTGHWEGDFDSIENWMMLVPLNVFHLDRNGNTELAGLTRRECGRIIDWLQNQFLLLLQTHDWQGPHPDIYEDFYYIVYGWDQPKKDNLTAYELESIEFDLPILYEEADNFQAAWYIAGDTEAPASIFQKVKGAQILRYHQGRTPRLNLIRKGKGEGRVQEGQ